MLAEPTSNTEIVFPREFVRRAIGLSGEMAWTAPDALLVVDWLFSHDIPIYGVELGREKDGHFQWIATSQQFSEAAALSAREATRFITEYQDLDSHPGNLFTMTWNVLPPVTVKTVMSA